MMTILRFIFRRLDRRPSPIGQIPSPHLLSLHVVDATRRSTFGQPLTFIR